jgi:hypothetical protein
MFYTQPLSRPTKGYSLRVNQRVPCTLLRECVEVNAWMHAGVWHGVVWCGVVWRGVCWHVAFGMVSRVCRGRGVGVGVGVVVPKSRSRHDIHACFVPLE